MNSDKFLKIAPWGFLVSAMYLPAYIIFILSVGLLATFKRELYRDLYAFMNSAAGVLLHMIPVALILCIVLAVAAGIMSKWKTFKKPHWLIGASALGIALLIMALAVSLLPHPPN